MSSENDALPWLPPWLPQSGEAGSDAPEQQAQTRPSNSQAPLSQPPAGPAIPQQPAPVPQQAAPPIVPQQPPAPPVPPQQPAPPPVFPLQQVAQHVRRPMFTPTAAPPRSDVAPRIDDVQLVRRMKRSPSTGWRRTVFRMSGGRVNLGQSVDEQHVDELVQRVRRPARGDYRIAVLSLKGGVGKTTMTVALGSTFSALRGDRVIAVDANPDFGTLGNRVPQQTRSTVRHLLHDTAIQRYSDVRAHTSQAKSRLEVLSSERDPATSEAFNEHEYRSVVKVLQRFYSILLTDCGTGLMHSAMKGVLGLAQTLVVVSSPAIDGARSAAATLDWLDQHGYQDLVRGAVVIINSARPDSPNLGMTQLQEYFADRCRAVHIIPFDEHLAQGAEIDLDLLDKSTRRAFLELAASVADDFQR